MSPQIPDAFYSSRSMALPLLLLLVLSRLLLLLPLLLLLLLLLLFRTVRSVGHQQIEASRLLRVLHDRVNAFHFGAFGWRDGFHLTLEEDEGGDAINWAAEVFVVLLIIGSELVLIPDPKLASSLLHAITHEQSAWASITPLAPQGMQLRICKLLAPRVCISLLPSSSCSSVQYNGRQS